MLIRFGVIDIVSANQPIEIFSDMNNQNKFLPQSYDPFFPDSTSSRQAIMHTIPRYGNIYKFAMVDFAKAESLFVNPLKPNELTLARGKNRFESFCSHCHGFTGHGDGTVITKAKLAEDEEGFPAPPDYHRPETKALSDARIFHIMSSGQNVMFPAADKLNTIDRWCIVLYIRYMQSQQ
jgi:mono/diheme cytochrome c family protein